MGAKATAVRAVVLVAAFAVSATACGSSGTDTAATDTTATDTTLAAADPTDLETGGVAGGPDMGDITRIGADDPMAEDPVAPGAERLRFAYGPLEIKPGQNNIEFSDLNVPKPDVDGYITRIAPNIMRADGSVPAVDVVHLHHGVLLNLSGEDPTVPRLPERLFAAGEEKTIARAPAGYGYEYEASDRWLINYMMHNLFPTTEEVYIVYDLDFIPADSPEAAEIRPVRPIWLDVVNGSVYPVFDVVQGTGDPLTGHYTYPDDAPGVAETGIHEWEVTLGGTLMGGAGHLHPGGLSVDLFLERAGAGAGASADVADDLVGDKLQLFSSKARYFDDGNPISWDLAMTRTPDDWRVEVQPGDVLSISTTYDASLGSWYESMGIFVVFLAPDEPGADPYQVRTNRQGEVTHGQLPENDNKGGGAGGLPIPAELPDGELTDVITIADFTYSAGDFSEGETTVPLVRQGDSITFDNSYDAPLENGIWHTITACQAPCNGATGIAFPLADDPVAFDSGQLGDDGVPTAGRLAWDTPGDLDVGTYTYFCRVHPFMRGAFRVVE